MAEAEVIRLRAVWVLVVYMMQLMVLGVVVCPLEYM